MIEIARFADVYEAEIASSRLRAEGFDPVLGGAEHVKTNPLVLMALGGVNLSVPDDQAHAARARLESLRQGAEQISDADPAAATPARDAKPLAVLAAVGLGVLLILAGWSYSPDFQEWARGYW